MNKILGIGNALVDALVKVDNEQILTELELPKGSMQLIAADRFVSVRERLSELHPARTTGGSACNTILAVAEMGGKTGLIGKIGTDDDGEFFAESFQRKGVQTQLLTHPTLRTGVASTIITPDGQRTFGTYLGAAAQMQADDLRAEWFEGARYLYIEGYLVQNHDLIRRAVEMAHHAGLLVCIDLASYNIVQADREFFRETLPHADIVFANEQEAEAFTEVADPQANIEALAALCPTAVVKIGKKGVLVRQGEQQEFCPARDVPVVVDTTAAGDYFSAGFLYAHSKGRSLLECAQLGSLLAGHIIEVVGTALTPETWAKIKAQTGY